MQPRFIHPVINSTIMHCIHNVKAHTEWGNWTERKWHGYDKMTNGWSGQAHWSVRRKLYYVSSVQLRRSVYILTQVTAQWCVTSRLSHQVLSEVKNCTQIKLQLQYFWLLISIIFQGFCRLQRENLRTAATSFYKLKSHPLSQATASNKCAFTQ